MFSGPSCISCGAQMTWDEQSGLWVCRTCFVDLDYLTGERDD